MTKKTLNTVTSGGGDITLSKKILTIADLPQMKFDLIKRSTAILPPLAEIRQIKTVAYTAANSTVYKFILEQFIQGERVSKEVRFASDASGSDAEIAAGLVNSFNLSKGGLKIVASGSASPITFTADAKYNSDYDIVGEPLFNIIAIENIDTIADAQTNHTSALRAGSITDATPCVVTTSPAHGLQTGDTIVLAGITTATTLNATWRVTVVDATSYSLDGSVLGTGSANVSAATAIQIAQASRGWRGDLLNDDIDGNDISDNIAYATIDIEYAKAAVELAGSKRDLDGFSSRLYVSAHSTTAPGYTATSNYAAFETRITERLKGVLAEDLVLFVGYKDFLPVAGTWTKTRGAQGDYYLRRTAAVASHVNGIDITAVLRTAAGKGFKLNSFDIIYGIATDAAVAHSVVLSKSVYVNDTAVDISTIATTGTLSTATDSDPYVTNIVVDSPLYNITDDSKYILDLTVEGDGGGLVYDFYGLMLKFTRTDVDFEALGNL